MNRSTELTAPSSRSDAPEAARTRLTVARIVGELEQDATVSSFLPRETLLMGASAIAVGRGGCAELAKTLGTSENEIVVAGRIVGTLLGQVKRVLL